MSSRKVLILNQEEKDQTVLQYNAAIKKLTADGATIKWATFDSFQEGKRAGTFDFVFACLNAMTEDDLGMSEEFYQYYASAPIFYAFVENEDEAVTTLLKGWNEKVIVKKTDAESANIAAAFTEASATYEQLFNDDVKPAFAQFDKDGSGAIDKKELQELSKKLGNELNDGDLEIALKDLDLNGDGVIDINEFARWYFSGMKSYGSNKRSMLKFHGHASKILGKAKEQAKLALVGQELKVKNHNFKVGFNDPKENAGTTMQYNLLIGGNSHQAQLNELSGWLSGTANESWAKEAGDGIKAFVQLKITTSNAEEKAAKFNELKDKIMARDEYKSVAKSVAIFNPIIKAASDGVLIGMEMCLPNDDRKLKKMLKLVDDEGLKDLIDMFKEIDQKVCAQVSLGTSLKSILSEEDKDTPLLKHLAKGFAVSTQVSLVSNLKKAISEMLKSESEEEQAIAQKMMLVAPAFIFGINANMNIEFDDFEEIAEHPMAAPAMATFEQLFEGMLEEAPESFMNKKLDLTGCEEVNAEVAGQMSLVNEIIEALCDLDSPEFNHISLKASYCQFPISSDIEIQSEGIGQAAKLALKAGALKFVATQASHVFDKELEEIYHD